MRRTMILLLVVPTTTFGPHAYADSAMLHSRLRGQKPAKSVELILLFAAYATVNGISTNNEILSICTSNYGSSFCFLAEEI